MREQDKDIRQMSGDEVEMTIVQPLGEDEESAQAPAGEPADDEDAGAADSETATDDGTQEGEKSDVEVLREAIQKQAREDEQPLSASFTLRKILGGDILTTQIMRRQIWLIVLIVFFVVLYISNRYSVQKDLLEIDRLNIQLKDAKYKALASSSLLTEKCRESHVLEMLKNNKDSLLKMPSQPPYIIEVPEK